MVRCLFGPELDLALIGLQNAGKTSFARVLACGAGDDGDAQLRRVRDRRRSAEEAAVAMLLGGGAVPGALSGTARTRTSSCG